MEGTLLPREDSPSEDAVSDDVIPPEPNNRSTTVGCTMWTPDEKAITVDLVRTYAAIYGTILFWVGSWNLIIQPVDSSTRPFTYLTPPTRARDAVCLVIGGVMLFLVDGVYANAGLSGGYWPLTWRQMSSLRWIRIPVGLVGTLLVWVGGYNLMAAIDGGQPRTPWLDVGFVWVGLLCVGLTGTLQLVSYIHVAPIESPLQYGDPVTDHMRAVFRSVVSFFGQVAIYVGAWSILSGYSRDTLWRNLAYVFLGLQLFLHTDALVGHAGIESPHRTDPIGGRPTVCLYIRSVMAVSGSTLHFCGGWMVLDTHTVPASVSRNLTFTVVGLCLLWWTKTLHGNAAISPLLLPNVDVEHSRQALDNVSVELEVESFV